jgi:hypothetical protein
MMLLSMIAWMKMRWLKLQMPEGKLRCFFSGTTTIIFLGGY